MFAYTQRLLVAVFLCLLFLSIALSSVQAQQTSLPVIGLKGKLLVSVGQGVSNLFVAADGRTYAMVGVTAALESEINVLRQREVEVQVWGMLYPTGLNPTLPLIVVSSILGPDIQRIPDPDAPPIATVIADNINVRSGPDTAYQPPIGVVVRTQQCIVSGRNAEQSWWLLRCSNGVGGWVSSQFLSLMGNTANVPLVNVAPPPPPTPTPVPTATPQVQTAWSVTYYDNPNLAGNPTTVQGAPDVNFNWGSGAPYPGMIQDRFSARFTRTINVTPGAYRFTIRADDGLRVYLDGQLIIDEWHYFDTARGVVFQADRTLNGTHSIRIDYYEETGDALINFTLEPVSTSNQPVALTIPQNGWVVEYFNNSNFSAPPGLVRNEGRSSAHYLNYEFGPVSPLPYQPDESDWSGQWQGHFYFEEGNYNFEGRGAGGGVRITIDDIVVIDGFNFPTDALRNTFRGVGTGYHLIKVQYYQIASYGWLRAHWWKESDAGTPR